MNRSVAQLRQAFRGLRNSPVHALITILTLSIGIGANAATFNVANWLIFRPVPGVRELDALVTIQYGGKSGKGRTPISYADAQFIAAGLPALTGVAGLTDIGGALSVNASVP